MYQLFDKMQRRMLGDSEKKTKKKTSVEELKTTGQTKKNVAFRLTLKHH